MGRKKKKKTVKVSKTKAIPVIDEGVVKLTELDALRFGKLDAEIRNHLQGVRLADMEIDQIQRTARERVIQLEVQREHLKALMKGLQPQYEALVKELAEKHGIPDPKRMVIDPEVGTVRDTQTDL